MFLRIPLELHEKLCRMVSKEIQKGNTAASINSVVVKLIESARDPSLKSA